MKITVIGAGRWGSCIALTAKCSSYPKQGRERKAIRKKYTGK